jgi:hypothetical protein
MRRYPMNRDSAKEAFSFCGEIHVDAELHKCFTEFFGFDIVPQIIYELVGFYFGDFSFTG